MIHVFVLLLVGIFNGAVANDTPANPFPTEQTCDDAATSFMAFAKSHGFSNPFSLACVPMVIMQPNRSDDRTEADGK